MKELSREHLKSFLENQVEAITGFKIPSKCFEPILQSVISRRIEKLRQQANEYGYDLVKRK